MNELFTSGSAGGAGWETAGPTRRVTGKLETLGREFKLPEIGRCYSVGEGLRAQFPPDQSLASRSVVNPQASV